MTMNNISTSGGFSAFNIRMVAGKRTFIRDHCYNDSDKALVSQCNEGMRFN